MVRIRLFLLAAAFTAFSGTTQAAVSYSYVSTQETVGSTVTVSFYLQETLTSGSVSFINGAGGGLTAAGFAVDVVSTNGGTASQLLKDSYVIPTSFGGPTAVIYNQGGNDLELIQAIGTAQPKLNVDGAGKIFLGTVNFAAGTGETTYRLSSLFNSTVLGGNGQLGGANGNTTTFLPTPLGTDLDVNSPAFTGANAVVGTFVVSAATTAVPEPTSMLLCGLAACGGLFRVVRRKPAIANADSPATI